MIDLYAFVRGWTGKRLREFKRWDFDEIANEAFLAAVKVAPTHDPDKAPLHLYLTLRIYEPIKRRYAYCNGIRIIRQRSGLGWERREYHSFEILDPKPQEIEAEPQRETIELPEFNGIAAEVVGLLARGLTRAQCARSMDVSGAYISQIATGIRKRWERHVEKEQEDR